MSLIGYVVSARHEMYYIATSSDNHSKYVAWFILAWMCNRFQLQLFIEFYLELEYRLVTVADLI